MNAEQQRVSSILLDSLALLCKNSLTFTTELTVQGLIGITVDRDNVFLVQIDQRFHPDETPDIKQEPYHDHDETGCANGSDAAQEPVKRRKKRGLKHQKFHPVEETRIEFNGNVKIEEPYEGDGTRYDDYGFNAENQSAFADDAAPVPAMYGDVGRSAGIAGTVETESYDLSDLVEGGDVDQQDIVAEPGEDLSWASEEDMNHMMQFSSGQNRQQFARGGMTRKSVPSSRGRTFKGSTRGRQHVRASQDMAPSGIRRLKVSPSDPYVINETSHLCGYPNCGKRFRFRHDLLRHQTKKHGRTPVLRGRGNRLGHSFEEFE